MLFLNILQPNTISVLLLTPQLATLSKDYEKDLYLRPNQQKSVLSGLKPVWRGGASYSINYL